jgi:hypothetical protein
LTEYLKKHDYPRRPKKVTRRTVPLKDTCKGGRRQHNHNGEAFLGLVILSFEKLEKPDHRSGDSLCGGVGLRQGPRHCRHIGTARVTFKKLMNHRKQSHHFSCKNVALRCPRGKERRGGGGDRSKRASADTHDNLGRGSPELRCINEIGGRLRGNQATTCSIQTSLHSLAYTSCVQNLILSTRVQPPPAAGTQAAHRSGKRIPTCR